MSSDSTVRFTVKFDQPLRVWVLQLGGWLPIQFTSAGIILVDRNITGALLKLAQYPDRTDMEADRWWLEQLNAERFVLNALLSASEGGSRALPTFSEFTAELAATNELLAQVLPKARLVTHEDRHLPLLYENVIATKARQHRESEFLVGIAPRVSVRLSNRDALCCEHEAIELARSLGLSLHSFVVLSVLSCLYEPQRGEQPRIGRGVIKPTREYSAEDAYNAIADIRALEFLAAASGLPGPTAGFCTRDKYLAALWSCLGVTEPTWTGTTFTAGISPSPRLFPRLNDQRVRELLSRLQ